MTGKKLPWNKQLAKDWKNYPAPVRPGLEMAIYEKIIKRVLAGNKNPRILILGSTPEFRDLLLKHKITPICCDVNPEVYKALKILMERNGKELFVESDWLDLDDAHRFDLIMGHNVINMIPINKQGLFIKNIADNLKPDGIFATTVVIRPVRKDVNPADGFERYRKLRIKTGKKMLFMISYPDLVFSIGQKKGYYTPSGILSKLRDMRRKRIIDDPEFKTMLEFIKPSSLKIRLPLRDKLENTFNKYYLIEDVKSITDKYFDPSYWPIYILRKNGYSQKL
ncbi:MAG: class I SAM-dependent methyltransferase [Candidatus Moranbacteria bacterium]|nr:class I SAM-dependent methyltransferase [Candidatus Moranbacteria bacterium]